MSATVLRQLKYQGQSFKAVRYFCAPFGIFWILLLAFIAPGLLAAESRTFVPERILVKTRHSLPDAEVDRRVAPFARGHRHLLRHSNVHVVTVAEQLAPALLASLAKDPEIEFAERDYVATASFIPNDPYVTDGTAWHLARIQAPQAWDLQAGDPSIIVAVLDSGVNAGHPDLTGRLLPGYDFVSGDNNPADDFGHGTAVTGTIVASGNNGQGVAGVAFGCTVLPVKVMDASGTASHSTLAQGIEYAVAQGARVINLSLGGDWPSSTLQDAINFAWSNNVVVIAAAGNGGGTTPQYPAACDHVVAVSATDQNDSRAWFSSYGNFVAVSAPGTAVWTTQKDLNNPYGAWSGTSFACPVAAGVAALIASSDPTLSNDQIVDLLKHSSDDIGGAGYDTSFGFGRVNAYRAVVAAQNGSNPSSPPIAVQLISPASGEDAPLGTTLTLTATASAGTGTVQSVTFLVNNVEIGTVAQAPFSLAWTPAQPGSYSVAAVAVDENSARASSIPAAIHISSPETTPPQITLTSGPANGARLSSSLVSLAGTATDNVGPAQVQLRLNNGPFQTVEGTSTWTAQVNLQPGTNAVHLRSVDQAGNVSAELTRVYTLVVAAPLNIQIVGLGRVTPDLNGRSLEAGKTYKVKAIPGPGQVFAGWDGFSSDSPVLTFVMSTNLTLAARFIPNPFPVVRGNYAGLMANTNGVTPGNSGYFNLTVSASGAFTGKLLLAGSRHSLHGHLDLSGDAVVLVNRTAATPLKVNVHVNLATPTDEVVGSVSDGRWVSALSGDRNVFNSHMNPATQAGSREFVLERAEDNATAASGSSRISSGGSTTVRGILSDGRRFGAGSILAKNGDCPFYLSLNRGNEVVIGWLNFPAGQGPVANGTVLWVKSGTNSFAATLRATGAPGQ